MIRLLDPYAFSLSLLVGMVGFGMNFFFNTNVSTWRINEIGYPLAGMVYVYIRNARFFPETEDSATGGNGGTENDDIKTEIKQPASPLDDLGSRLVVGQPLSRPSKGELVVVFFWASWCSNSIKFLPGLLATAARYREEGVAFLGVSQESEEDLRDFVEGYSRPLKGVPLSADDRGSLTRAYQVPHGVNTIPHAYVIRGEGAGSNGGGSKGCGGASWGTVQWHGHPTRLETALQELLDEEPTQVDAVDGTGGLEVVGGGKGKTD